MEYSINKPYFARLDFARDGETKVETLYIGKFGVMEEENNNITMYQQYNKNKIQL